MIETWSVGTGSATLQHTLEIDDDLTALAVSPDGAELWTGHEEGRLCIRDLATGAVLREDAFPDPWMVYDVEERDWVASLAFDPSGRRVALSIAPSIHVTVIDAETLEVLHASDHLGAHFGEAMPVRWSPDGDRVLAAYWCGGGRLLEFTEEDAGGRAIVDRAGPPRFAGGRGACISGGQVLELDASGRPSR